MKRTLLTLILLGATAGPVAAQTYASRSTVGVRAYGSVDVTMPAATRSIEAVFGDSRLVAIGGGAEVDVWKRVFLRVAVSHLTRTGSRVFTDGPGGVFRLHIPLTMTMTPIEAGGGWRFVSRSRFTPYLGGAFVSVGYGETSDFAQTGDNVSERYTGGEGFGGVDVTVWKRIVVGGEAQFRRIAVPDVSTSVMHQFGETDLGGFTARVRVGVGFP